MFIMLLLMNSFITIAGVKNDDIETYRQSEVSAVPSYIQFKKGKEPLVQNVQQWLIATYNLSPKNNFKIVSQESDQLGYTHYRYQQTYNGIAIEGSRLVLHVKQGYVYSLNGVVFDGIQTAEIAPKIQAKIALKSVFSHVKAEKYKWEDAEEEKQLKITSDNSLATYYPEAKLVYAFKKGKLVKNNLCLAYKFDVYAIKPLYRAYVYIDAVTGEIINEESRIHFTDVPGTANTAYSGNQPIVADSYTGGYRLREAGRGNGIETYNLQQGINYGSAVDFVDANNIWSNVNPQLDQYATDVHWGTEKTYDFYWTNFNRNSIDNNGFKIQSYVHYDVDYFNAFWDGSVMTYGDGEPGTANPLVSIDIVGHEITHGLTELTAGLIYNSESGGLNESFSDIFGQSIEFYAKPATANWLLGNEIGYTIRSMSNPNSFGDPDTYHGLNWDPFEEVHNISGVQNFWFYLLSMGGSGTNDNGANYSVSGIGVSNAAKIAYRNLTVYLTPNSNYADARYYAIQSAIDLFGPCSPEVAATANAWYAVGVGGVYSNTVQSDFTANVTTLCSAPGTVNFINNSSNGINFLWYFGDGTTSTQVNPSHTYANYGVYSVKLVTYGGSCGRDSITKSSYININASNVCPIPIPVAGSATQTTCSGILTDDGGSTANYSPYSSGEITIAPSGATQITLNFSSFDFESGYDYLKIYAGPNTSFPLYGSYTGASLPGGGNLVINSGVITIQQTSDASVERSGFFLDWQCSNNPVPPVANFSADSTISCSGFVHFVDMSTNTPTSWLWNFGDGSTSTLQNPVHHYLSNGVYNVTLQAINAIGSNSYTRYNYIDVNNAYCNGISMPGGSGSGVTQTSCNGILYDNGGQLGNYSDNTNSSIVIAPTGATQITVNFSLFNFENNFDFVEIYDGPSVIPGQLLGHYTGSVSPGTLTFNTGVITILQHSDASVVIDGFAMSWACTNAAIQPTANFSQDSTSSCFGTIHFYDFSSGIPTSWLWNFGDGTTSTMQNPIHHYTNNGNYNVSLQVSNSSGSNTYNAYNLIHINNAICSAVSMPGTGYGQNLTSCSGMLTDNGGISGNYSDNTNSVMSIIPTGATQITLNFSAFNMETNFDTLFIYGGATVSAPIIGSYTGNMLPNRGSSIIINGGAVTIQQKTDYSVNMSGFEMGWSCNLANGIKDNKASVSIVTLYPNPAHDAITVNYISESSELVKVKLSDALGKSLTTMEIGSDNSQTHQTIIDLSSFSDGIYFVELTDGTKSITKKFVLIR